MIDILIGMGCGALIGTLIIACIWVPWYILWCRREDRRFDIMNKAIDAGRDKALRELGVDEETIALFYTKRAEYLNDLEL